MHAPAAHFGLFYFFKVVKGKDFKDICRFCKCAVSLYWPAIYIYIPSRVILFHYQLYWPPYSN